MRISFSLLVTLSAAAVISVGCGGLGGPERKLGRGLSNISEIGRGTELRRTMEQTAVFEGGDVAYTKGFLKGMNRTFARTFVGISEVLTFPFPTPTYDAYFIPEKYFMDPYQRIPVDPFTENLNSPDSYVPRLFADQTWATDSVVGFSGGDIIPFIPGSRFRIFDYP
jgi:putative exosortase-associated protein (TIGR04073 family)